MEPGFGIATLLAIVLASLGFGLAGSRLAPLPARPLPWAVAGVFGLAVLSWLGGWLILAGVYSRLGSLALLATGGALLLAARRGVPRPRPAVPAPAASSRTASVTLALAAGALVAVRTLGAIRSPFVDPCDDWATYYHFPRLLLESGGFVEPFNLRRLGVLGAGPFLQSFLWPFWTTGAPAIADAFLGQIALWAAARESVRLFAGDTSVRGWRVEAAGLAALLASLTIPLANSSPTLLPLAGAVVLLWLTVALARACTVRSGLLLAVAWGTVGAWLVAFRTLNAIFPALLWLCAGVYAGVRRDGPALRLQAIAASALALALLPWSLASWQSSGTPLFPLFEGNFRFASFLTAPLDVSETLGFVGRCLAVSRVWLVVLLVVLLLPVRRARFAALQCGVAALGSVVATALSMTASNTFNVFRYAAPFVVAGLVFLGCAWLASGLRSPAARCAPSGLARGLRSPAARCASPDSRVGLLAGEAGAGRRLRAAVLSLGVGLWLWMPATLDWSFHADDVPHYEMAWKHSARSLRAAGASLRGGLRERPIPGAEHFVAAQRLLDADARVVSAVSKPFLWRFDAQVVHTLDCPGQASPPPGMPFFHGPAALAEYWLDLGYTHLAFTPPDTTAKGVGNCLYSRRRWRALGGSGIFLWEQWAPYFLDFMENEEKLWSWLGARYESPDVVLVDLRRARGSDER